jgi:hypothetical protein
MVKKVASDSPHTRHAIKQEKQNLPTGLAKTKSNLRRRKWTANPG